MEGQTKKHKPWERQKELLNKDIPSMVDLHSLVLSIPELRTRALVILEYLTGGRVTEIVGRNYQIVREEREREDQEPEWTYTTKKTQRERFVYKDKLYDSSGVKKKDIVFMDMTKANGEIAPVMLIKMGNRKNRKKKRKEIPIHIQKETVLITELVRYLDTLDHEKELFPFGKVRAYQLIMKATGFNNHYFRHIRASHLVIYHNFNEHQLIRYLGWTDGRPAKSYVQLRIQDLLY